MLKWHIYVTSKGSYTLVVVPHSTTYYIESQLR